MFAPDKHYIKILTTCIGVVGASSLIALPAYSQLSPSYGYNAGLDRTSPNDSLIRISPQMSSPSSTTSYPYGSRVDASGTISTPQGQLTQPAVTINNGDGSTTYYYRNGGSVTVDRNKVPPTGTPLR